MRKYELVIIAQPDLDDNAFNGIIEKARGWIVESGGSVEKVDVWGRRPLTYLIRKQREGLFVLLNISMPPSASAELERNLRFQETILRFMITVVA
jgi:small subunit ribosomal protein S6